MNTEEVIAKARKLVQVLRDEADRISRSADQLETLTMYNKSDIKESLEHDFEDMSGDYPWLKE